MSIARKDPTVTPSRLDYFTLRDEAEIMIIQLQRTLVLWVLALYEKLGQGPKQRIDYHQMPRALQVKSDRDIESLVLWLRNVRSRGLVRMAFRLHRLLDRSKRAKVFLLNLFLWTRFFYWKFFPNRQFGNYNRWILNFEKNDDIRFSEHSGFAAAAMTTQFTIVLWDLRLDEIQSFVPSLIGQRYKKWLLVLFVPEDQRDQAGKFLKDVPNNVLVETEPDITARFALLAKQKSDYYVFIRRPGRLAKHALCVLSEGFVDVNHPPHIFYGDEDSINLKGTRTAPRFYSEWDFDFHLGQNLFRNMVGLSNDAILALAQEPKQGDLDCSLLRLAEKVNHQSIKHCPSVLFHSLEDPKLRSIEVQGWDKIVRDFLAKRDPAISFGRSTWSGAQQIIWPLPAQLPKVSVIIPTRDRVELLRVLVEGLLNKTDYPIEEIIIIDNCSQDPVTLTFLEKISREFNNVRVLKYDQPFNYSAINNFGFQKSHGDIIAFLNNDLEIIHKDWLSELVRQVARPGVGGVGAKLYYKNNFIQHAGVVMGFSQVAGHIHQTLHRTARGYCDRLTFVHSYSAVTGACLVVKREVFEKIGGFNEESLAVALNDVDLCLKIWEAGFKVLWTPFAELYHHESATRPIDTQEGQLKRFHSEVRYMREHWQKLIDNDPFYHPKLVRASYFFQLQSF